jgi:broad specificity phosphatase PhoE
VRTLADPDPVVLVTVGLPARGKTYLARKIARFVSWLGHPARVFNVGNYRRRLLGSSQPARFFDPANAQGRAAREQMAMAALDDLLRFVAEGPGRVAIYDATNGTRARRELVRSRLESIGIRPIFLEVVCTDDAIVEANIRETKLSMPDYAGVEPDKAVADFRARLAFYEKSYEPLDEPDQSWMRVVDTGRQVVLNQIRGYLPSRIAFYVTHLHLEPRPILLTRHGESTFNIEGRIGGDSPLTVRGAEFAVRLAGWLREELGDAPVPVWTSTLRRTIDTAAVLQRPTKALRNLDEIDAGTYDGWTYAEIEQRAPDEWAARKADKLRYRYPRGESYEDVIQRLEPVIVSLEQQRGPVLVIAHQAVFRCLYGYFTEKNPEECPFLDAPLHTVVQLVPRAYGVQETRITLEN